MRRAVDLTQIALHAIWGNKLRSTLTILGNIVSVGSIIAVVSLIQGVNDEVAGAIVSEFGSDSFLVDRTGLLMTEDDVEAARSNPRISLDDAEAIQGYGSSLGALMAEAGRNGEVRYRNQVLENVGIRGVTRDYIEFPTFTAEQGRLISPTEVERNRGVALLGYDTADRLFGSLDPIDRTIKIQGVNFRVIGVSEATPSTFGQSQDEFVIIPMGRFRKLFGSRPSMNLRARPKTPEQLDRAMDDATVALRIERKLRPREDDNFGLFTSDTVLDLYEQATTGIFAVLIGVVGLSLLVGGIVEARGCERFGRVAATVTKFLPEFLHVEILCVGSQNEVSRVDDPEHLVEMLEFFAREEHHLLYELAAVRVVADQGERGRRSLALAGRVIEQEAVEIVQHGFEP